MIIDKLDNMSLYKNIPNCVLDFVESILNTNVQNLKLGRYELNDKIYANIETYSTKGVIEGNFEAHKKYIDIQFVLSGKERIYVTEVNEKLNVKAPYSEEKDIVFYSNPINDNMNVVLNGVNFVMLFPHEAHAPQISIDNDTNTVLKVVVKIQV